MSFATLPDLGVGLLYNRALAGFLRAGIDAVDFIEVIPDLLRRDAGLGCVPRFQPLPTQIELLDWVAARKPLIAHSIGLSIGSAGLFDTAYVAELAHWQRRYGFPWHSEHLSFTRLPDDGGSDHHAALALPVPCDNEALALVAARVGAVRDAVPVPLLLENNVYFTDIPEQEMDEPAFLNALAVEAGCGLLLDLHNLYTNSRNHGVSARGFLAALDLTHVVEVHISGGSDLNGIYIDSHAGSVPEEVWDLLAEVVRTAPNLRAVTFEFDESYCPVLGEAGLRACLERAHAIRAEVPSCH